MYCIIHVSPSYENVRDTCFQYRFKTEAHEYEHFDVHLSRRIIADRMRKTQLKCVCVLKYINVKFNMHELSV